MTQSETPTLAADDQAISELGASANNTSEADEAAPGRRYCIFDTETSGLTNFSLPADDPSQPRVAQFAAILTDENLEIVETINLFAKPDGWEVEPGALKVNGLTTEILNEKGIPIGEILDRYIEIIDRGFIMVAYNAQFDLKMMRGELRRASRPDRFEDTPNICAMRAAKADMNFGGRAFPKLSVACEHYGVTLENAHEAGADAMAAYEIFKALHAIGALPEPKVYFAKNPPAGK